jgi:hypothetical protein
MDPENIAVGDDVSDSPVGAGKVTDITSAGYPRVNHVAVVWLERPDGARFDPHNKHGGSQPGGKY